MRLFFHSHSSLWSYRAVRMPLGSTEAIDPTKALFSTAFKPSGSKVTAQNVTSQQETSSLKLLKSCCNPSINCRKDIFTCHNPKNTPLPRPEWCHDAQEQETILSHPSIHSAPPPLHLANRSNDVVRTPPRNMTCINHSAPAVNPAN